MLSYWCHLRLVGSNQKCRTMLHHYISIWRNWDRLWWPWRWRHLKTTHDLKYCEKCFDEIFKKKFDFFFFWNLDFFCSPNKAFFLLTIHMTLWHKTTNYDITYLPTFIILTDIDDQAMLQEFSMQNMQYYDVISFTLVLECIL